MIFKEVTGSRKPDFCRHSVIFNTPENKVCQLWVKPLLNLNVTINVTKFSVYNCQKYQPNICMGSGCR